MLENGDMLYVFSERQADGEEKGRYVARSATSDWSKPTLLASDYKLGDVATNGSRFYVTGKLGERTVMAMQLPGKSLDMAPLDAPSENIVAYGNRVLAHWIENPSATGALRAAHYVPGVGFDAPTSISDDDEDVSSVELPAFSFDQEGTATVVYVDERTASLKARRSTTNGFSEAETLHTNIQKPQITSAQSGDVIAAWSSADTWGIWVSRFVPNATQH
jgi:hypothetical protein